MVRKYKLWFHVFYENGKKQFMSPPWKICEIILRGISKIYEYVPYSHQFNLKFAEEIKGFDPHHIFL